MDATAEALAVEAPAYDEDAALDAAYDKASAEPETVESPAAEPAKEEPTIAETVAEEAPTDLPAAVRKEWAALTPEARDAVVSAQRDMGRKLSDSMRLVQGLEPIRSVLAKAVADMPHLANMKPEQVAADVLSLARISAQFAENPVAAFMGLAKKHGIEAQLRAAFSGQEAPAADLHKEIATLRGELARVADPDYFREQVSAVALQERAMADVTAFSETAEHWGAIEPHLPQVIPLVQSQLGPSASPRDVLKRAYDVALGIYLPDVKATAAPADKAPALPDPARTATALKAKSVNVPGGTTGKAAPMSEDDALDAAWDRAQRK